MSRQASRLDTMTMSLDRIKAAATRRETADAQAIKAKAGLRAAQAMHKTATESLRRALEDAHSEGVPMRTLAPSAGLSYQRVHQILTEQV